MNRNGTLLKFPKRVRKPGEKSSLEDGPAQRVVDMTERRDAILLEERRNVKRTILTEFIGASVVIPGKGLERVNIYDISENGLAFDMASQSGYFRIDDEIAVRVYLNHQTYFAFFVKVANVREFPDDGVFRHGCVLIDESLNRDALKHFAKFIETVSAGLKTDQGDILVSNIR